MDDNLIRFRNKGFECRIRNDKRRKMTNNIFNRKPIRVQISMVFIMSLLVLYAIPSAEVKGMAEVPEQGTMSDTGTADQSGQDMSSESGTANQPGQDTLLPSTENQSGQDTPDGQGTENQPGQVQDPCADGHKEQEGQLKPANARQDGHTAGSYCSVCGEQLTEPERIAKINIKSLSLKKESFFYNGKAIQPKVTVMDREGNKISSQYFTVKYKNNKKVGKAKAVVTFTGNYKGKAVKTFFINGWKTDGSYYYLDGKKAKNTFVKSFRKTYYVGGDGIRYTGWIKIGKDYYYLKRTNGVQVKDSIVDGIPVDRDGKAEKSSYNNEKIETMMRARAIMQEATAVTDTKEQKLQKVFQWVLQHPYRQYRKLRNARNTSGWEMTFANDEFLKGYGCCVSEACAFSFLAHECGYKTVYICDDTGHAWTEINGRVYDTLFAEAKDYNRYYNSSYADAKLWVVNKTLI